MSRSPTEASLSSQKWPWWLAGSSPQDRGLISASAARKQRPSVHSAPPAGNLRGAFPWSPLAVLLAPKQGGAIPKEPLGGQVHPVPAQTTWRGHRHQAPGWHPRDPERSAAVTVGSSFGADRDRYEELHSRLSSILGELAMFSWGYSPSIQKLHVSPLPSSSSAFPTSRGETGLSYTTLLESTGRDMNPPLA